MHYKTQTLKTTIHDEIIEWANNRNGKPVRLPNDEPHRPGLGNIKIKFPEESGEYEEISWRQFLEDFENKKLMMIYQENTEDGKQSHFYTLEKRNPDNNFK